MKQQKHHNQLKGKKIVRIEIRRFANAECTIEMEFMYLIFRQGWP